MDNKSIIYIIITVIIILVSLLGKKKKKSEIPRAQEKHNYFLNDFEKLLQSREEYVQEIEEKTELPEEELDNYHTDIESENLPEAVKEPVTIADAEPDKSMDEEEDDGFDLKSAVIYSSILERKKFKP